MNEQEFFLKQLELEAAIIELQSQYDFLYFAINYIHQEGIYENSAICEYSQDIYNEFKSLVQMFAG